MFKHFYQYIQDSIISDQLSLYTQFDELEYRYITDILKSLDHYLNVWHTEIS